MPLHGEEPLGTTRDGGGHDARELGRSLDRAAVASALTPLCVPGFATCDGLRLLDGVDPPPHERVGALRPAVPEHGGLCAGAARGAIAYLALLCIARI